MAGMTEEELDRGFDDLDAFFSAAAKADKGEVRQAAEKMFPPPAAAHKTGATAAIPAPNPPNPPDPIPGLPDQFIAIDADDKSTEPFLLIPAGIHASIPWWGWTSILVSLLILFAGVMLFPAFNLSRLAAQLEAEDPDTAHFAMRQFVVSGDKRAVDRLYDLAASPQSRLNARLRAVDTLGIMPSDEADTALLRLEMVEKAGTPVQEAASAARRQREQERNRVRFR